jgi:P-type E1-E2 ATPase
MERLRDQVAPTDSVLRGGEWKEIRRRDVVPGDIIRLSAGDLVPADARLLVAPAKRRLLSRTTQTNEVKRGHAMAVAN